MTYDQWLEEAQRAADVHAVHFGRTAQYTDVAHILFRRAFEQDRWPTFEAAVNDAWGTTLPVPAPPEPPPLPETALIGRLRLTPEGFADDRGPVLPRFIHDGDWFGLYVRDPVRVKEQVHLAKAAGWQGGRAWTALGSPYWESKARDVSPTHPVWGRQYWDRWTDFVALCASLNWRILVSQGDINALAETWDGRLEAARRFAQAAAPYPWVYATFDAVNEGYATGEYDPDRLGQFIQEYRDAGGTAILTRTSPENSSREEVARCALPPAQLFETEHGVTRQGGPIDMIRRAFNAGFESGHPLPFGISSEGVGPDKSDPPIISGVPNVKDVDAEVIGLVAVASTIGGVLWVWMSGEGVWCRDGLQTEAGFYSTPQLLQMLPQDIFSYQTPFHFGDRFADIRGLSSTEPDVRGDSRLHDDGRVVTILHGPSGQHWFDVKRSFEGIVIMFDPDRRSWTAYPVAWSRGNGAIVVWKRGVVLVGRYL